MFPWLDFLLIIISRTLNVYLDITFWLFLAIIAFQYHQMQKQQLKMFGVSRNTVRKQILYAALFGTVGGILGSFLLSILGVTLEQVGLGYLWPVALLLMLINMRFMCFAYAGGIVALAHLLLGWPTVNVPQLMALVAGLHFTESLLIFISGRYSAAPLVLKRADGRLVGAFNLQNLWPLPLVLLTAMSVPEISLPGDIINMPEWWPLLPIGQSLAEGHTWLYRAVPVVAALGYADIAVTSSPLQRRRQSAWHLTIYSVLLLILALLSVRFVWLQYLAALVSPLGHELLIQLDNRRELGGPPMFVPPPRGVMILDTAADTPAQRIGLRPGDVLLELANMSVNSGYDLARAISFAPTEFAIKLCREGKTLTKDTCFTGGERRLGIILVPEGWEQNYVEVVDKRFGLLDWLLRRWRS
jgi:hypothetical protein